jgi:hypothetical protein
MPHISYCSFFVSVQKAWRRIDDKEVSRASLFAGVED